ncbi:hypothetical protein [Flavobacterium sp. KACC 22761]|uniref:hypothetical protein n=1 Tax=Flavobacterium sp. KACC 22761 TaxID=3092665 RepID=UPI002A7616EE|nr:hypothetical protein [Flavobacterium sp. KACC 22761]WPO77073.1 hypothetical protein SCB73_12460 [Flavobacterium sp. KACC 22761]
MKAEFVPLAEWIDKTYEVKTINIIYDTLDNKTPRIQICFEFEKEKSKFLTQGISYFDKTKQKAIGEKFAEIINQQGLSKSNNLISKILNSNNNGIYLTDNVFVVYGAFEPIAKIEATYKIKKEQTDKFINSFHNKDIWTISIGFTIPTFFMFTDEKVKEYDRSEIKKMWADKYYEFVKPFDEFNYFNRNDIQVFIDSKENFDKNYESNWYYYYK